MESIAKSGQEIMSYVERIEKIASEIAALNEDKKTLFNQLKCDGFDVQIVKAIIKARKMDDDEREEKMELLKMYGASIGIPLTLF